MKPSDDFDFEEELNDPPLHHDSQTVFDLMVATASYDFFNQFPTDTRALLCREMAIGMVKRGDKLTFNYDDSDPFLSTKNALYVVLRGKAQVGVIGADFGPGDTVGFRGVPDSDKGPSPEASSGNKGHDAESRAESPVVLGSTFEPVLMKAQTVTPKISSTKFTRRGSLSGALTKGRQSVYAKTTLILGKVPYNICSRLFADPEVCRSIVWAPCVSRAILNLPDPTERNDMECACIIELLRSVPYLNEQSTAMQRLLARQFMYAKVNKGNALCFWQNVIGGSKNCEWFVVSINGTLGIYAEKAKVKSFLEEKDEEEEVSAEDGSKESDENEEEGETVDLVPRNLSQVIKAGQAFPLASQIPLEKSWWGFNEVNTFETNSENKKGGKGSTDQSVTQCNYCIAGASETVELLYMPLNLFKAFVYPSQDLMFSTEKCRTVLKVPPKERKLSEISYLLNNVLKSHAFFQQMTLAARSRIATNMTIGFIDEGELLVDVGEFATATYILLSGSAKICVESTDGIQRWSSNGSPTTSPVLSQGRVLSASKIRKLEPGDIFGAEMMIHKTPSKVMLKVTEPSEFIVVTEANYRDALGMRDLLQDKVEENEFKGLTLEHVMSKNGRLDHPAFAVLRNAPSALLSKISASIHLRTLPPRRTLGMSDGIFTMILHGSVSLHRAKKRDKNKFAVQSGGNSPEAPTPRASAIEREALQNEVENRRVRSWWRNRKVDAAERIVEGGVVVGGYECKINGSMGGYHCYTREHTLVAEFDVTEMDQYATFESSSRQRASVKVGEALINLGSTGSNAFSMVDKMHILKLFETNPVLCEFPPDLVHRLATSCCEVQVYEPGSNIKHANGDGGVESLTIILEGRAEIWCDNTSASLVEKLGEEGVGDEEKAPTITHDMKRVCLGMLEVGDWFGDEAFDDDPYLESTFNAYAHNCVKVIRISRVGVMEAVERRDVMENNVREMRWRLDQERKQRKKERELQAERERIRAEVEEKRRVEDEERRMFEEGGGENWTSGEWGAEEGDFFLTTKSSCGDEGGGGRLEVDVEVSGVEGLGKVLNFSPVKRREMRAEAEVEEEKIGGEFGGSGSGSGRGGGPEVPIQLLAKCMRNKRVKGMERKGGDKDEEYHKPGRVLKTLLRDATSLYATVGAISPRTDRTGRRSMSTSTSLSRSTSASSSYSNYSNYSSYSKSGSRGGTGAGQRGSFRSGGRSSISSLRSGSSRGGGRVGVGSAGGGGEGGGIPRGAATYPTSIFPIREGAVIRPMVKRGAAPTNVRRMKMAASMGF
ncbi:hypothetical protein TrVE_jg12679 [Triparma verrucosa]|uniref:Cyclic nucleotide-binding domain-containing protein n=1 Tax=Triparma verrucosa TaxID=1606542 RepID=A0A9W7BXB8_9STRA|nr:hypothetical protein TrVE_jg12679 [Triparma verrucosa]